MRRALVILLEGERIPRALAPPQPKHWFIWFGIEFHFSSLVLDLDRISRIAFCKELGKTRAEPGGTGLEPVRIRMQENLKPQAESLCHKTSSNGIHLGLATNPG